MVALSDSTVTSGSSSPMVSPSATLISITGTSSKPSSEGTFTTSVREPPDFFFFGAGLLSSDLASDFSSALSSGLPSSASSEPPASPLAASMPITSPSFTLSPTFTDRKSTRLNSSHVRISYAVFCLKKKKKNTHPSLHSFHTPDTFPSLFSVFLSTAPTLIPYRYCSAHYLPRSRSRLLLPAFAHCCP